MITNVCIVCRICVHTVFLIWCCAISIVIIRLTVLHKTAHGSTEVTILKIRQIIWKFNPIVLCNVFINRSDSHTGIDSEPMLMDTILIFGFNLFVVVCTSIEYLLIKYIAFFRNSFPQKITTRVFFKNCLHGFWISINTKCKFHFRFSVMTTGCTL